MDKKADMPFWLVMLIVALATLFVVLAMVFAIKGNFNEFLDWLR